MSARSRRAGMLLFALLFASQSSVACRAKKTGKTDQGGSANPAVPALQPGFNQHTVLVVDDGFDITHEVFKDKILATYTIACKQTAQIGRAHV